MSLSRQRPRVSARGSAMAGRLRIDQGTQSGAQAGFSPTSLLARCCWEVPRKPGKEFFWQVATLKRMTRRLRE